MKKLFSILTLLFTTLAWAQPVRFSAEIDTNRILIGDQFTLQLKGEVNEGTNFEWPIIPDTISGLDFVDISKIDTTLKDGIWQLSQKLTLTSFDSGYVAIPPLTLKANGEEASSQAIAVAVAFPELSEEQDYYDIKEPLEPPFNWMPILIGVGILIVLAVGVWLFIKWWKKRKANKELTPEQMMSPYEYAQLQLSEIEKEQLLQSGKIKEYYSRLTDVMRLYMERQMSINAMESTADELIDKMKELRLATELKEKIDRLLHLSALVKYAKEKPSTSQNDEALVTVKHFLEQTKPAEKEENAELSV
ncbi:hypothetical protein [Owenweeksia hongkongensis]|uniref:hypothetical protein n=1 Tax=Owenweeksia hongkongensis TaxID=253245 RepID=UPI003A9192F4